MTSILDLDRYPLDQPDSTAWRSMVETSARGLANEGMFDLEGLLLPGVAERAVDEIRPVMETNAFEHRRLHNIYFRRSVAGLDADHPALQEVETINHTVCADQIAGSLVMAIYHYEPLRHFLAATLGKPSLHPMRDPLAQANVISYRDGEALNWHFDRSEFTVTLLLQEPLLGGDFEYRGGLRSDDDPNYAGVARLIAGADPEVRKRRLIPGSLNVFRGKNTAHRVTPVQGARDRVVAVFSYYESQGVMFSDEERIGFYGRAA